MRWWILWFMTTAWVLARRTIHSSSSVLFVSWIYADEAGVAANATFEREQQVVRIVLLAARLIDRLID
jgi:hypothetical protein